MSDFQDDVDVAIYTDYRALLAHGGVDTGNDLTTLAWHHQAGTAALDAAQYLVARQPLAISIQAIRRLVNLARQRGLTLGLFANVHEVPHVGR